MVESATDIRGEGGVSAHVRPAALGDGHADTILNQAGIAVWRWEPGMGLAWTPRDSVLGSDQTDALRQIDDLIQLCHPDDRDRVAEQLAAATAQGGAGSLEHRMRGEHGRWRHMRISYQTEAMADGRHALFGISQDITELAEARDAALRVEHQVRGLMEESRVNARRLKLALGAAQAGVFEIDHEAETFWCSPEFVLLIGRQLSYEEANALPWSFIHPDDQASVTEASKVWMTGSLLNAPLDLRIVRPDGAVRWVRLYFELKRDVRGKARRSVGLMLDFDERKRQELALIEAQRAAQAGGEAKSHFLASVSHEIRTPMNGILGVLHLLKTEELTGEGRKLIDEALACGRMLSELINDVLDFSKIEADQLEICPEPTNLVETLEGVASLLQPQCDAKGLYLRLKVDPAIGWAMVDPIRLRQSLFNLIGNAVKFTLKGGVEVRLTAQGEGARRKLRFEVQDTGVGIPPEAQGFLFQRFQQADSSTTRRFGGTGLGLAITRRLAEMMDGGVGFDSVDGEGSTFWLEIVAAPAEAVLAAPELDAACLEGLRVLVVEDNPTNRLIATKILENLGASIETAEDGHEGVAAAVRGGFDLILMDVQMPRMDGMEATRQIRALDSPVARTPIIALTANVLAHQRDTYLAAGMNGVAAKPISPAALMAEIARIAEAAEDSDEAEAAA
jgi:signal transduction histidine kinase/ActR/RegA family two-component response regulator